MLTQKEAPAYHVTVQTDNGAIKTAWRQAVSLLEPALVMEVRVTVSTSHIRVPAFSVQLWLLTALSC